MIWLGAWQLVLFHLYFHFTGTHSAEAKLYPPDLVSDLMCSSLGQYSDGPSPGGWTPPESVLLDRIAVLDPVK